jgi:hypothetical protein
MIALEEDVIFSERQRTERIGPDFDIDYFSKLDRLIEENYVPIVKYTIVSECRSPRQTAKISKENIEMPNLIKCDVCDETEAFKYLSEAKFVYGAGEEEALLVATVEVTECRVCGETYTGENGEIQRERAVRDHIAALSGARINLPSDL